jgi:hypothetical protein
MVHLISGRAEVQPIKLAAAPAYSIIARELFFVC